MRCKAASASAPRTVNLAKVDWSKSPTAVRVARHSSTAILEPVLALEAVLVFRLDPGGREPVGALPTGHFAETGVVRLQALVERGLAHAHGRSRTGGRASAWRRAAEGLGDTVDEEALVVLVRHGAAAVDVPEVEGRMALGDPVGKRHADAAGGLDADRVEAGGDVEVLELERRAEQVALVGGEALGAVEGTCGMPVSARRGTRWMAPCSTGSKWSKSSGQLGEAEILGDAVDGPGLGLRLEGTDEQLAGVFLVVGAGRPCRA